MFSAFIWLMFCDLRNPRQQISRLLECRETCQNMSFYPSSWVPSEFFHTTLSNLYFKVPVNLKKYLYIYVYSDRFFHLILTGMLDFSKSLFIWNPLFSWWVLYIPANVSVVSITYVYVCNSIYYSVWIRAACKLFLEHLVLSAVDPGCQF